jgi:hypothetical protein
MMPLRRLARLVEDSGDRAADRVERIETAPLTLSTSCAAWLLPRASSRRVGFGLGFPASDCFLVERDIGIAVCRFDLAPDLAIDYPGASCRAVAEFGLDLAVLVHQRWRAPLTGCCACAATLLASGARSRRRSGARLVLRQRGLVVLRSSRS